jgi:ribosomal protein L37AE/L43A
MTTKALEEMNEELSRLLEEINRTDHEVDTCPSCDEPALHVGENAVVCENCGYHERR